MLLLCCRGAQAFDGCYQVGSVDHAWCRAPSWDTRGGRAEGGSTAGGRGTLLAARGWARGCWPLALAAVALTIRLTLLPLVWASPIVGVGAGHILLPALVIAVTRWGSWSCSLPGPGAGSGSTTSSWSLAPGLAVLACLPTLLALSLGLEGGGRGGVCNLC